MPCRYRIDRDQRLVEVVIDGVISDEDIVELAERMRADPALRPDDRHLVDARRASGLEVSNETVRLLAHTEPLFVPGVRRAIVVATSLEFGLARMFQMLGEDRSGQVGVFRDMDEALAWLGMEEAAS